MAREAAAVTTERMLRIIRLVNDLAHAVGEVDDLLGDEDGPGEAAVPLSVFAQMLDMEPAKVVRIIDKINLGCGDSVPELYIDYDADRQLIVPHPISMALDRPLRLSPIEARALLAVIETSGIDEASGLAQKIEGAFPPINADKLAAVKNAAQQGEIGGLLQRILHAIDTRTVLALTYQGLNDVVARERRVEPCAVSYDAGEGMWYLHAYCHEAGAWRVFKLSRIERAETCDETFEMPAANEVPHGLQAIDEAPAALLSVHDPRAIVDPFAWRGLKRIEKGRDCKDGGAAGTGDEDGYRATIPWVRESTWLPRMIAQTCGGVEALNPPELRTAVREEASRMREALLQET